MNETSEKLKVFHSPTKSKWRENAKIRLANQKERRKARKIAMSMLNAMDRQGISAESLSDRLGVACDELMPILKGQHLPSDTLSKSIESALEISL